MGMHPIKHSRFIVRSTCGSPPLRFLRVLQILKFLFAFWFQA